MNLNRFRIFLALGIAVLLVANPASAEDTNTAAAMTREEANKNYLQIQEQLHATQLLMEQNQQAALNAAKNNAETLSARLQSLEQSVATQRSTDAETARKTQQLTLLLAGAFGLAGLGIMLLMVYFQWRAFTQLAEISSSQHAAIANGNAAQTLTLPGRATVESSNSRLLEMVDQLEKRIHELEGGQRMLPVTNGAIPADPLADAQKFIDANQPQLALESLDKALTARPENADALVKKAVALEKLGRNEEALACCDRAITVDGTLALAHLHKGGLLNRLRRYDEALDCYERALLAQEKKPAVRA